MSIVPWDSGKELDQLRARTDQLWDAFFAKFTADSAGGQGVGFLPDADVVETAYDFRVFMAVPGLIEEDIDIEASPMTLIVRGERQPPYDPKREHVREWRYGFFERLLTFKKPIVVDKIRATYEAGVLTVVMPKQEADESQGRQI